MLTNDKIKELFLQCENTDPDGLYADDVDLLEFSRKIESASIEEAVKKERDECIKFVRSLNIQVAKALKEWRDGQQRARTGA